MAGNTWVRFGYEKCCEDFLGNTEFLRHISESHVKGYFEVDENSYGVYEICDTIADSLGYNPGCDCVECIRVQFNCSKYKFSRAEEEIKVLKSKLKGKTGPT
jgi:hypothetical protein